MSGFINQICWCKNISFDQTTKPLVGDFTADGQLLIGAAVAPFARPAIPTGSNGITITPGAGTLDIAGSGTFAQQQIYYVGKHGNNANAGTNINTAVLTFTQALTLAAAALPTAVNRFAVVCLDDGIYTENITCVQFVDIYAPNAQLTGTITAADDCSVKFRAQSVATATIGISKLAGTGAFTSDIDSITVAGTGIAILGVSGILQAKWKTMIVENGFGVGDLTSAAAHMHIEGKDLYISGTGTGIARANAGTTLGHVDHILNIGAGTGNAINNLAGEMDLTVDYIGTTNGVIVSVGTLNLQVGNINVAGNAYNISGGELNLSFEVITAGARVQTGGTLRLWRPPTVMTNGQLVIGSTGTDPAVGSLASAGGTITITPGAGTINLEAAASMAINMSPYIVGATQSDFTTIQAGITQAIADGASATNPKTILVKPGTYTENLTLADGIWIVGQSDDVPNPTIAVGTSEPLRPAVTVDGTITLSGGIAVLAAIQGIRCVNTVSTDIFLITGAASYPSLIISKCLVIPTVGDAIDIAAAATGATFQIENSQFQCTNAFFDDNSSAGIEFRINSCRISQASGSVSDNSLFMEFKNSYLTGSSYTQTAVGASPTVRGSYSIVAASFTLNTTVAANFQFYHSRIVSGTHTLTSVVNAVYYLSMCDQTNAGAAVPQFFDCTLTDNMVLRRTGSGATVTSTVSNLTDAANSNALYQATVGGTSAGDPMATYTVTGGSAFTLGVDNSDSDKFKISASTALGTTDTQVITTAGEITKPLQPSFLATPSGSTANVTGDGTAFTCIFDTEIYDQNSDFNTGTYKFTAPVTGVYLFCANILIGNIGAGHTTCGLDLVTTARTINFVDINSAAVKDAATNMNVGGSSFANMTAGDTAHLQLALYNSTKTITYSAGSYFSGALIC